MNEFEEKLESILNNPQAMEQIMSLAQSLGGSTSSPTNSHTESAVSDTPFDSSILSGLDPGMMSGLLSLLAKSNQGDDERTALLQALRPFVNAKRFAKLDKAIQIAKFSRLIRMALELFRTKEDSHV